MTTDTDRQRVYVGRCRTCLEIQAAVIVAAGKETIGETLKDMLDKHLSVEIEDGPIYLGGRCDH